MSLLSINGSECPTPSSYKLSHMLISKANRNANGDMIIKKITEKKKLELSWLHLKQEDLITLNRLINGSIEFTVRYFDDETNGYQTMNCYRGDKSVDLKSFVNGKPVWTGISVNFIEV